MNNITCEVMKARDSNGKLYYSIYTQSTSGEFSSYKHVLDRYDLEKFNINYNQFKKLIKPYNVIFIKSINYIGGGGLYNCWAFIKEEDAIKCKNELLEPLIIAGIMSKERK